MISVAPDIVTGNRVRVRSPRGATRPWLRKGTVEKIHLEALLAFVRYSDLSGEWVEVERLRAIPPPP
jgi:hypothetical protein